MSRALEEFRLDDTGAVETASRRRLDRATARALASAVAALAIATIVVSESSSALDPRGTASGNEFSTGSIALVDDDEGRALVTLENMVPGRPVERCITITYAGTVLPVDLTLAAGTSGDVAPFVQVRAERGDTGSAGAYGSCDGFVAADTVFEGSMEDLADRPPVAAGSLHSESEQAVFRFTFDLDDLDAAEGRAGSVDFVWEAVPG